MSQRKSAKKVQIRIEATAATLLLVVLAALTMLLISSTGNSYNSIVKSGESSQDIRTAMLFVATKVRQTGSGENIGVVRSPWGSNALVITESVGGSGGKNIFEDWIFYYRGALRETLIPKGTKINPQSCQIISNLSAFSISLSGSILDITAQAPGQNIAPQKLTQKLALTLRS